MFATNQSESGTGVAPVKSTKTIVLGLGNEMLCDDAVGLVIARALRSRTMGEERIEVTETTEMGLSLLDFIVGYRRLIVIDAVQTGCAPVGYLHELHETDLKIVPGMSPHFVGIGEIVALGRELGLAMPQRLKILGVEVADPFTMSTSLTPALAEALPALVARVEAIAREFACVMSGEDQKTMEAKRSTLNV